MDSTSPPVTVLVGFAEAQAAPETVWSLVDRGFSVIAFARKGRYSPLRHSRLVVCHEICQPETDLQAALSDLRSLMDTVATEAPMSQLVLFPLDDTAVWLASRVKLDGGWLLAGPSGQNAELALNKSVQIQMAREAGFAVPETLCARTSREVFEFCDAQSCPVILKPAECVPITQNRIRGSRKWVCANRLELERAVAEWAERIPLLVQPFVAGTGEGVFGLATVDGIRAWSAHKRLRMMNPQGSGSSACVSRPATEDLRSKIEKLMRLTKWRGLFMIELLRDCSGDAWFVELNGRPWGSMALSRRRGLEYPSWQVSLAIDPKFQIEMGETSASEVVCRNAGREIMHMLFVLRGPKSKALNNWPPFWKTVGQVMRVRSGEVFYNWKREDPKVFIADCYYTIRGNLFKKHS